MATLRALKDLGVRLAIDDFGTGYSSLSYLRQFPVDILKIDRSFVDGMAGEGGDATLAEAVVQMGRALRLQTVAEGIETTDQWSALRASRLRATARATCSPGRSSPRRSRRCWPSRGRWRLPNMTPR